MEGDSDYTLPPLPIGRVLTCTDKEKFDAMVARIAALEAQLEDADNRIEELQALLREWSSGEMVKALEARFAEERRVRGIMVRAFGFLGEVRYFCTHCCGVQTINPAVSGMTVCEKCGYCMGRIDPKPEHVAALAAAAKLEEGG